MEHGTGENEQGAITIEPFSGNPEEGKRKVSWSMRRDLSLILCFPAQVGLHSIIQFETGIKRVAEQEQSKWQFEEEIKALGAEEVQAEFSGYFASIVRFIPPCTQSQHLIR